jgi:hypothetical protein
LAPSNGVGVQAGDLGEQGDPSAAVLVGEEADEQAAEPFVGGSDEAIDPPMLPSATAMGVLSAGRAGTNVDGTRGVLLGHVTLPPWAERERAKVILPVVH